jgi:putative transposase
MRATHALANSLHDAAWTQFASFLACKAAWADRRVGAVTPADTSQDCSGCGWRHPGLTLADRMFHCQTPARPECGWVLDRDRNASLNSLARGKALLNQHRPM